MSSFAAEMAMTKCQGERVCTLFADESTFGNQCPLGTRKYLTVSYACGKNFPPTFESSFVYSIVFSLEINSFFFSLKNFSATKTPD